MNKLFFCQIILLVLFHILLPAPVQAQESFVTVINPVRSRIFWKSADALSQQLIQIRDKSISATWLIQYSNLFDEEVIQTLKSGATTQEIGLFLEVDEKLAEDSNVPYLFGDGDWARPDKVFLSGYKPEARLRMLDRLFSKFKAVFGFYPKSVGAWYIDAVSLNYLVQKYKITAILDCNDQYQTDKYGLWGKPWGNPYYPSKLNSLIPAQSSFDKLDAVKIQWAQRDPVFGYGLTVSDSTYSVQANDYLSHPELPSTYFENLAQSYLAGKNTINQLTLGLEVGQEGSEFFDEFDRQLEIINSFKNKQKIRFVTMSEFASVFKNFNPEISTSNYIEGSDWTNSKHRAFWFSSPFYRIGLILENDKLIIRDLRNYSQLISYADIADNDSEKILKRIIPPCIDSTISGNSQILATDVENVVAVDHKKYKELILYQKENLFKRLFLDDKSVRLNDEIIFEVEKQLRLSDKFNRYLITAVIEKINTAPHELNAGFRFSKLEGIWYLGFMIAPDKFAGAYAKSPFVGILNFPFQVLSRFRELPRFNTEKLLLNLVNSPRKCTIKL